MRIACDPTAFSIEERAAHQAMLTSTVMGKAQKPRELRDGYELSYEYDAALVQELAGWMTGERRCCPFLQFELLVLPSGERPVRLRLRGSDETKRVVAEMLRLAGPP